MGDRKNKHEPYKYFEFLISKQISRQLLDEILVHRFQKQFPKRQLSALIIFLSVGHYSKKSGNSIMRYMTYVGEYYNREKKLYTACYYSLLV